MIDKSKIRKIKELIKEQRDNLSVWFYSASPEEKAQCCYDNNCAVDSVIEKHNKALERIESGEFGKCVLCHADVECERLEIDFTTEVCLGHYSDEDLRLLEKDLELAAKVQQHLLPQKPPVIEGLDIAAHSEPARIVSGDYFDYFNYKHGQPGVVVADVMGKGLPASMLMSNLQASLRILGPEYDDTEKLASRLNELFRYNLKLIKFITLFLLKIDTKQKRLSYCNSGHNPAFFWDSGEKILRRLMPTGPAIGLMPEAVFKSDEIKYSNGDLFVLYTDGLTEIRNKNEEEFGEKRVESFILEHLDDSSEEIIKGLRKQVKTFGTNINDDLTLVVIKF